MADFEKVALRELDDDARAHGMPEELSARFARPALGLERIGLSLQRLAPGYRIFGHRHESEDEVYVVVAGSGRAKVGEELVELAHWDALRVSARAWRAFEGGPDGLEYLAFGGPRDEAGEMDQGFWPG